METRVGCKFPEHKLQVLCTIYSEKKCIGHPVHPPRKAKPTIIEELIEEIDDRDEEKEVAPPKQILVKDVNGQISEL
jgi:hypothetical protein